MSNDITFGDAARLEQEGASAGLNPMLGEWQQTFKFAPVPYGDGGAKRQAFREAIQAELANRWVYSHEIQLEITLHLDVQTVLETSETADLDNYAKAILDGLKGPKGIMFDDTQVQALAISWLDGYGEPSFTVEAKSSPDEFMLKPIEFYEMPDGLWYPHGRYVWSEGGKEPMSDRNHFAGLSIVSAPTSGANMCPRWRAAFIAAALTTAVSRFIRDGSGRTNVGNGKRPITAKSNRWRRSSPRRGDLMK